jgi:hypothetical protein
MTLFQNNFLKIIIRPVTVAARSKIRTVLDHLNSGIATSNPVQYFTRLCPKISGLAARSENCKWYSSLPLGAVVSLSFLSQSSEFCCHNPLCSFSASVCCLFRQSGNFWIYPTIPFSVSAHSKMPSQYLSKERNNIQVQGDWK